MQESHIHLLKHLTVKGTQKSPRKKNTVCSNSGIAFGESDLRNELLLDHGILNFPDPKTEGGENLTLLQVYFRDTVSLVVKFELNFFHKILMFKDRMYIQDLSTHTHTKKNKHKKLLFTRVFTELR